MRKPALTIGLALLLFLPEQTSRGCGDPGPWNYSFYDFFNQEVKISSDQIPFLLQPETPLYKDYPGLGDLNKASSENLSYWMDYFEGDQVKIEDVKKFLYQASVKELEQVRSAIGKPGFWRVLDQNLKENSLAQYWQRNSDTNSVQYFLLAKETQHFTHIRSRTYEKKDTLGMKMALEKAIQRFEKTEEPFIKQRYGYQAVRLFHYLDRNDEGIRFYERNESYLRHNEQFYYWILEQLAGMYRARNEEARASYYYGIVFNNCPARRVVALESYRITSEDQWESAFGLCKNPEEQAALYTMRALQPYGYVVEEMENIYKADPASRFLDLLLMREVKKIEEDILRKIRAVEAQSVLPRNVDELEYRSPPLAELIEFCEEVISEENRPNTDHWQLVIGYLRFLSRDFEGADRTFATMKKGLADSNVVRDLELYTFLSRFSTIQELRPQTEDSLYAQFRKIHSSYLKSGDEVRAEAFKEYFFDRVGHIYLLQGELGKSFLCHDVSLRRNPNLTIIKSIKAFVSREPASSLEKYLQGRAPGNDHLQEFEGTAYFKLAIEKPDSHKVFLFRALQSYKTISDSFYEEGLSYKYYMGSVDHPYTERMFNAFVIDVFNYPKPDAGYKLWQSHKWMQHQYSKRDIVETVFKMDSIATSRSVEAAEFSFMLGNLFYNLTYHGVYRHVLHYSHTPGYTGNLIGGMYGHIDFSERYNFKSYGSGNYVINPALAAQYYKKAYYQTKDQELKSWCSFMLAKCDQAKLIAEGKIKSNPYSSSGEEELYLDQVHRPNLARFHEKYQGTALYDQAYERCSYLRLYANDH